MYFFSAATGAMHPTDNEKVEVEENSLQFNRIFF